MKVSHVEYFRKNLVLDEDLRMRIMEWHDGQGSTLYALGSPSGYVSPALVDAGINALADESLGDHYPEDLQLRRQLLRERDELLDDLEGVVVHAQEFTTREAGLGDIDSGWDTRLMAEDVDDENMVSVLWEAFGPAPLKRLSEDPELRALLAGRPGDDPWVSLAVVSDKLMSEGFEPLYVDPDNYEPGPAAPVALQRIQHHAGAPAVRRDESRSQLRRQRLKRRLMR